MFKKIVVATASVVVLGGLVGCGSDDSGSTTATSDSLTQYVDTTIGTGGLGNTYPGATVPHGMIQLSPDNGVSGWDYIGGYHYYDDPDGNSGPPQLVGFSHTHLSGTGAGDMYDLRVMPINSQSDLLRGNKEASKFSHDNEIATAGYYRVLLDDYGINAELTTTERVGFHRYQFPADDRSEIVIDPGFTLNWDLPTETQIKVVDYKTVVGYRMSNGWAADQREYFVIKFSQPFKTYRLFEYEYGEDGVEIDDKQVTNDFTRGYFEFNTPEATDVEVKVAMSSVSVEGAYRNMEAEADGLNFNQARQRANLQWETELAKVKIPTDDSQYNDEKRIFYTALYHSLLGPTLHSDVDGRYKGADNAVHPKKAVGYDRYDTFSLWDTYRAAHPLYTILEPERVNDMVKSMLAHYDETGRLPVWTLKGNETNMMQGYHSVPVIADAMLKGIGDFDHDRAFDAMVATANHSEIPGMTEYSDQSIGYVYFSENKDDIDDGTADAAAASKTLEYAYDDWSIAAVAGMLNEPSAIIGQYEKRAGNWKNQFTNVSGRGWMVPRLADGNFIDDFDPERYYYNPGVEGKEFAAGFTESNAWHYLTSVPHDVEGLITEMEAIEGDGAFEKRLDEMFETSPSDAHELPIFSTGMVGQYVQGNEPDMHVPYLYNFVGAPWKTQQWLKEIINVCYDDTPEGICGNDDYGQTSAWYIFTAMGFYPVNPANGVYVIGKPLFPELTISMPGNVKFTVIAENVSDENIYIQSAKLNGNDLERSYITHKELEMGGELRFEMGPQPNKEWAADETAYPTSGLPES